MVPPDKVEHYISIARTVLRLKLAKLVQLQSLEGSLNFASIESPLLQVRLEDLHRLTKQFSQMLVLAPFRQPFDLAQRNASQFSGL